jgi:hypothetical protein
MRLSPRLIPALALALAAAVSGCNCNQQVSKAKPELQVDKTSVDYGPLCLDSSRVKLVTFRNAGNAPMSIQAVTVDPPYVVSDIPASLAALGKGSVKVTWTPTAEGGPANTKSLTIKTDGGTKSVSLTGNGFSGIMNPQLHIICDNAGDVRDPCVNTSQIFNGNNPVPVGTESRIRIKLYNEGCPDLTVKSFTFIDTNTGTVVPDSPFRVDPVAPTHDLPESLSGFPPTGSPADFTKEWDLVYKPVKTDVVFHRMQVETDDPASPAKVTVIGSGAAPQLELKPTYFDYGSVPVGQPTPHTFTVHNAGAAPLHVTSVAMSQSASSAWTPSGVAVPFDVAPLGDQALTLTYKATGGCQRDHDFLVVKAGVVTASAELKGGAAPQVAAVPPIVQFAVTGDKKFQIQNQGFSDLDVSSIDLVKDYPAGTWSIVGGLPGPSGYPFTLKPGDFREITVHFIDSPTVAQELGQIDVGSSDCGTATLSVVLQAASSTDLPPNAQFTISPGAPRVDDTVTLDASGSTDPEGKPLLYQWKLTTYPPASALRDVDAPTSKITTIKPDIAGKYTVQLKVTDPGGNTDTASNQFTAQ